GDSDAGRTSPFAARTLRHGRGSRPHVAILLAGRTARPGHESPRQVANLLAHLRGLAVSSLDLVDDLSGDAARRPVLFQALEHLAFGRKENFEKFAQFVRRRLLLAGRLQRLTMLAGLIPVVQELLARGGRRLRRAASELRRRRPKRQNGERERQWKSPADRPPPISRCYPERSSVNVLTAL